MNPHNKSTLLKLGLFYNKNGAASVYEKHSTQGGFPTPIQHLASVVL